MISAGSPQDLLTRTCTRSCKDFLEDVSRIFARSSHKDLYKIIQPKDLWQDFIRIFTTASHKDLYKNLGEDLRISRTSKTAPWNSCKIVRQGPCRELKVSPCQDLKESAKMGTASQQEQSGTPKVLRRLRGRYQKMSTGLQQERSDTHKVPRELREGHQNLHRATRRAIWHP